MTITAIGLDVAKNAFQVRGADATASDQGLVEIRAGAAPCLPSGAIYMQVATSQQGPPSEPDGSVEERRRHRHPLRGVPRRARLGRDG